MPNPFGRAVETLCQTVTETLSRLGTLEMGKILGNLFAYSKFSFRFQNSRRKRKAWESQREIKKKIFEHPALYHPLGGG
jgi:hypothetical protein